jgi:hypothetical protein
MPRDAQRDKLKKREKNKSFLETVTRKKGREGHKIDRYQYKRNAQQEVIGEVHM